MSAYLTLALTLTRTGFHYKLAAPSKATPTLIWNLVLALSLTLTLSGFDPGATVTFQGNWSPFLDHNRDSNLWAPYGHAGGGIGHASHMSHMPLDHNRDSNFSPSIDQLRTLLCAQMS